MPATLWYYYAGVGAPVAPDTPTITAGTPGAATCPLTSSAFADANGDGHEASQWQVTTAADTGFAAPVFDSGEDASHLVSITATGLALDTAYIARVRHKDDSGDGATEWSEWSATDSFTTAEEPTNWATGIFPDLLTPVDEEDPDDPAVRAEAGLAATNRRTFVRVKVEDADGVMQDVGDLSNEDLFDDLTIEASTDQLISRATLSLWRAVGEKSLAPLMEGSTLNRDSGGFYAPVLNPNRSITVEVATLEQGETLVSTDWALIFDGLVDELDWAGPQVKLHARDRVAELNDTMISTVTTYGDDGGSKNIDDVMQDILDDVFGVDAWPLAVIGTPILPIAEYELGNVSVLDALKALADLIGWNIHYRWNRAEQEFRLTFWEPDRANVEPFWTFGPDDYYDVSKIALGVEGIRNVAEVVYTDVNGDEQTVDDDRPTSVALYGERFIRVDARGTSIVTATQANNLLAAVLDDLQNPKVNQVIEAALFWPIDLGDVHTYEANGVHYDTDQTWACFAYVHEISPDRVRTTISAAGRPSGGFARWLRGEKVAPPARAGTPSVLAEFSRDAEDLTATLTLTIRDDRAAITAVEFSKREGSQAGDVFGAYASTWDTAPTTPPYDGVWIETIAVPAGEESAIQWRVTFTDAVGTERSIGSTHYTSQIDEHEVERLYQVSSGKASLVGPFDIDSGGAAHPDGAGEQTAIWVPVLLPEGVEVTGAAIRSFQGDFSGGDVAGAAFHRVADGGVTLLGNVNGTADGWNTYTNVSIAEAVGADDSYTFQVTLQQFAAGGAATDARARWVSVTYVKHTQREGV